MTRGQPNSDYYSKSPIEYRFWDEGSNTTLAEYGDRNDLPCAGVWLLGQGFIFCIEYAAHSYNEMSKIYEFNEKVCGVDKWYELRLHFEEYLHTLFITKDISRNEVAEQLGL